MSRQVEVQVKPAYLERNSHPEERKFFFTYTITIHNRGDAPVQLLRRSWLIIDSEEQRQEVEGDGVVGQQPVIGPGQSFTYTSGVMLETPVGTMQGNYQMEDQRGETFDVPIAPFLLAVPGLIH